MKKRQRGISTSAALATAALWIAPELVAQPTILDSAGVRIVENRLPTWDHPWQVDQEIATAVGAVEGESDQLLYRVVGAARLASGVLVVANGGSRELLFYDQDGRFMRQAGGEGGGPGEFNMLTWFSSLAGDSVVAADARTRRLSFFDSSGEFVRSVTLEARPEVNFPGPIGFFSDGSFLVQQGALALAASGPTRVERPTATLYRYSPAGEVIGQVAVFPGQELSIAETGAVVDGVPVFGRALREFGRGAAFAVYGRRFFVADNASYEIQVHDLDSGLVMLIRKTHDPVPVTNDDVQGFRQAILERVEDAERRRVIERAMASWPDPPETMPAFGADLRLDPEGNLLVRAYAPPGQEAGADWDVFGPSGAWLGTLATPPGIALLSVGVDHVVGLRTDEYGVEYVQVHKLSKGVDEVGR